MDQWVETVIILAACWCICKCLLYSNTTLNEMTPGSLPNKLKPEVEYLLTNAGPACIGAEVIRYKQPICRGGYSRGFFASFYPMVSRWTENRTETIKEFINYSLNTWLIDRLTQNLLNIQSQNITMPTRMDASLNLSWSLKNWLNWPTGKKQNFKQNNVSLIRWANPPRVPIWQKLWPVFFVISPFLIVTLK